MSDYRPTTDKALILVGHDGRRGALLRAPISLALAVLENAGQPRIWDSTKNAWRFSTRAVDSIAVALADNLGESNVRVLDANTKRRRALPSRPVGDDTPSGRFLSAPWWAWPLRADDLTSEGWSAERILDAMQERAPRVWLRDLWHDSQRDLWTADHGCPSGHAHSADLFLAVSPDGEDGWLVDPLPDFPAPGCAGIAPIEARVSTHELQRLGFMNPVIDPSAPSSASDALEGGPNE